MTHEERIFQGLAVIANLDGHLEPEELDILTRLMRRFNIPRARAQKIIEEVRAGKLKTVPIPSDKTERLGLFELWVRTACSDGEVDARERRLLDRLADRTGVARDMVGQMIGAYLAEYNPRLTQHPWRWAKKYPLPAGAVLLAVLYAAYALLSAVGGLLSPVDRAAWGLHDPGKDWTLRDMARLASNPDEAFRHIEKAWTATPATRPRSAQVVALMLDSDAAALDRAMRVSDELPAMALSDRLREGKKIPWAQIGKRHGRWLKQWILQNVEAVAAAASTADLKEIDRATSGAVGPLIDIISARWRREGRWGDLIELSKELSVTVRPIVADDDWRTAQAVVPLVTPAFREDHTPDNAAAHLALALAGEPISPRLKQTMSQWLPSLTDPNLEAFLDRPSDDAEWRRALEAEQIRREIKSFETRSLSMPAAVPRGAEPRPGVSLIEIDNDTDQSLTVYFQGPEVFKVMLEPRAREGVELVSGGYLTAASRPDGRVSLGRAHYAGRFHTTFYLVAGGAVCTTEHPITRKLP